MNYRHDKPKPPRARINPERAALDDSTAYMPRVEDRQPPIWSPNVPDGYKESTNVRKPEVTVTRPTGGLKVFLDALLFIAGATVVGAFAILSVKLLAALWAVL
jgi:hypothetical protein